VTRLALGLAGVVPGLLALALLSFAVPVRVWRTGELPAPPLPVVEGGPTVTMPRRVWIDTDAACGQGRTTDPDDCFAILLLARTPGVEIAGISTVFGNAPLDVTDRTTRTLVAMLGREGPGVLPPVYRGSAGPVGADGSVGPAPAHAALREALEEGPLTLLALGPLTNLAAALRDRPDLRPNVARLVAVMGRRPGHLFHPAEGAGGGILFGHGPVFRDLNFDLDRAAASSVLATRPPTTLVPYDAGRRLGLTGADLDRLEAHGGAAAWAASRARGWLAFWREDVGRDGFYPFDLLAGAYVLDPGLFGCAPAAAWVGKDRELWHIVHDPDTLLVGPPRRGWPSTARASADVVYCTDVSGRLHDWVVRRLAGTGGPDRGEEAS
jgi:inosine-uridine nucleoside N-ribohydrolase